MARPGGVKRIGKAGFLTSRQTLKRFGPATFRKYWPGG